MEHILKILRVSSKKGFILLKDRSPLFCKSLEQEVLITNVLYKHINGYQKSRATEEIVHRLGMINIIDDVLYQGEIFEERENVSYEGKIFSHTYKISSNIKGIYFIVLVGRKENNELIALSCFTKIVQ